METPLPKNGKFLMLALDHREGFRKIINPESPDAVSKDLIVNYKFQILTSLKDQFTACLIDDDYGLPAYKMLNPQPKTPFLLAIENTGFREENGERITIVEKKAEDLKKLGASAVKLLIYFNPDAKSATRQMETAKRVIEDAHANQLPLFLEIVTYDTEAEGRVLDSLKTFITTGVRPDVWKLEFPGSEELCELVTEECKGTPWILLTRGASYSLFCDQLEIAVKNGCQGFLAGRSLWQDLLQIKNENEKQTFLKVTLPSRFDELTDIVANFSKKKRRITAET